MAVSLRKAIDAHCKWCIYDPLSGDGRTEREPNDQPRGLRKVNIDLLGEYARELARVVKFKQIEFGRYFVSKRSPELGPLMKAGTGLAIDEDDREIGIAADDEVYPA